MPRHALHIALFAALLAFILAPWRALSQSARKNAAVTGRVMSGRTHLALPGVHVRLAEAADTTKATVVETGSDGMFRVADVKRGRYILTATFLGYAPLRRTVDAGSADLNLGEIVLGETVIPLSGVTVEGTPPPAAVKGDTTEYDARAFKTNPDAAAEDLVAKMPGVTVENGTVKAQGEDVQQVLVDGRPFFGNDPTLALRNLPADAIEKIQVFDKMSEQAEFTGFDDGQSVKTMNFITRPERRNQQFGKSYAGYGDDDRYLAGGSFNLFHGDTRVSGIGLTNNVNQQNF